MANNSNATILKPGLSIIKNSTAPQNSTYIGTAHDEVAPFIYLGILLTSSLVFNVKLVYTVAEKQAMRSRVNILLAVMAISDLMVTCINMPLAAYKLFSRYWKIGRLACIFNVAVFQVVGNMKVFLLFFILSDRYHVAFHRYIFTPLEAKPSPWKIAFFSMALSTLLAIPQPLLSIVKTMDDSFGFCICHHKGSDEIEVYPMAIIAITICLILVIVLFKIINACRKQRFRVAQHPPRMPSRIHKKDRFNEVYRVTKSNILILFGLTIMQCVCVIPLEIVEVYIFISHRFPSNQLYIAVLWLYYTSAIANPIACYCQKIRILDRGYRGRRILRRMLRFMPRNRRRKYIVNATFDVPAEKVNFSRL